MNDWRSRARQDRLQFYADILMNIHDRFNEQFGDWLFGQVLPEIRRTGKYTGREPPSITLLSTVLSFPDDPALTPADFLLDMVKLLDELRDEENHELR